MKSFLQSEDWVQFQKSLGRKVFEVAGAKVIRHDLPFGKNYLYIPYGPQIMNHESWSMNHFGQEIRELAKQEGSIFVKAEPMQDEVAQQLVAIGFKKSNKNIQPHKTVVIDLTKSEDELLDSMHHKTRYNIKVAEKHGVVVRQIQNPNDKIQTDAFWKLIQKTSARDKFNPYPRSYYEKLLNIPAYADLFNTQLWFAYHNDQPIAGAIIATYDDEVYYLHGASDHEHRAMMAPYALHWAIIRNLKLGIGNLRSYDLWGIDSQKYPGVTRFKLGWGGRTIEYPGAFDLVITRPWYWMYSVAQKIR